MAFLELDIVETDENMQIVSIYTNVLVSSKFGQTKMFNQRSNIRHKNILVRWIYLAVYAVPQFFGIANDDIQLISVPLFDHVDNSIFKMDKAVITLKPEFLRFYKADITVMAQLEGLQYYMKKWFLTTLIIKVCLMTTISVIIQLLSTYTTWIWIRRRIERHLDYGRCDNSLIKLYILRSIF